MLERASALLSADHDELILQTIEPGEEDNPGLVEAGRVLEDVARERRRRLQNTLESSSVADRQSRQSSGSCRRDGVEDSQKRVGISFPIARNQFNIVEVVPGIH